MYEIINWLGENYIELIAAIAGVMYIVLSVKQNPWLWLFGIITSVTYIYVYFVSKFYADMSLQFYYLFVSVYGWIIWVNGSNPNKKEELKITKTNLKTGLILFFITVIIFAMYAFVLKRTDSTVPYGDSFTTALSITGTWMLARKKFEHWYVWMIVNPVAIGLYVYKGLYITALLFVVYFAFSIIGYLQWKKDYSKNRIL